MISVQMCECALDFPLCVLYVLMWKRSRVEHLCLWRIRAELQVNKRRIETNSSETQRSQTISQSSEP